MFCDHLSNNTLGLCPHTIIVFFFNINPNCAESQLVIICYCALIYNAL